MLIKLQWNPKRNRRSRKPADSRFAAMCHIQNLEQRTLLTTSALFSRGELSVVVDEGDDSITVGIDPLSPGLVQVTVNGFVDSGLPPVPASSVERLVVVGSDTDNAIDLSGVLASDFTFVDSISGEALQIEVDAGNGHDSITGSPDFAATLIGGHGNDVITAIGASEGLTIDGGNGSDTIMAGDGADLIRGGDNSDSITAGDGNDTVFGADGHDTVAGDAGDDLILGGSGADSITGGDGDDSIVGANGVDFIDGGFGRDTIRGGALNDVLIGGVGADVVTGNGGNDLIDGGVSDDFVTGQAGNDTVSGGGGEDTVVGGAGNDLLNGGLDGDQIYGGSGNDTVDGGSGEDRIFGQAGSDTVSGGGDGDIVNGGDGADFVESGESMSLDIPSVSIDDLTLFEGDGFIFEDTITTSNSASPFFGTSADLDGDGDQDFAVPFDDGTITSFLNDGTGVFTEGETTSFTTSMVFEPVSDSGDFDGDGLDDIVISSFFDGSAVVMRSTGGGQFGAPVNVPMGPGVLGVKAEDMDGDGDVDIVASNPGAQGGVFFPDTTGQIFVALGNGNGAFGASVGVGAVAGNVFTGSRQFDVADLDGDGDLDVIVANENVNNVGILLNDGAGGLTALGTTMTSGSPARVDTGDLDGDGDQDAVVTINQADGILLVRPADVLINDGTGVFNLSSTIAPAQAATGEGGLFVVDVDSDSDDDVLLGTSNGQSLFINNGAGALTEAAVFRATGFPIDIDYNGDGRIDFIGNGLGGTDFEQFRNNFVGPITASVTVSLSIPSTQTVTVDYDTESVLATEDVDFTGVNGTITFAPGVTTQTIDIPLTNELLVESDENFRVVLSSPVNAVIRDGEGHVGILDDDNGPPGPSISVGDVTAPEGELVSTVDVTLVRSGDVSGSATVDYETIDVSAGGDSDFIITSGTATFAPGTSSVVISLLIVGDLRPENDETFLLSLLNPVNVVLRNTTAVVTIIDDDGPPPPPINVDTLIGGNGRDTLSGGTDSDVLIGNGGADRIFGNDGNDTVYGGAGDDTIDGGDGSDSLVGNNGRDSLIGGLGDDVIVWRGDKDGRDTYSIEPGFDTVEVDGDGGGDNFVVSQDGSDLLISEGTRFIRITGDELGFAAGAEVVQINGNNGNDVVTINDIDNVGYHLIFVDGGNGNDKITAAGADIGRLPVVLDGGSGNDTVTGSTGGDTIHGSSGNDLLSGGDGDDFITGGAGDDLIDGQNGDDVVSGNDGVDNLRGSAGDDLLDGGADNDVADGGDGNDTLNGGFGNDNLRGSAGNDQLNGQFDRDTLNGGSGADTLDGGRSNDTLNGNSGDDVLRGDHGRDLLRGRGGNDRLNGGDGHDTVQGGDGADGLSGGDGDDMITGGLGNDTISGGDGADQALGGGGNDAIVGNDGDDSLTGNSGADTLGGNLGADVYNSDAFDLIDENFVLSGAMLANLDTSI